MKRNNKDHDVVNLFKSYAHHERRQNVMEGNGDGGQNLNPLERVGPADSSLIWQVARATSAAPTYFSSIKIGNAEYIDGGFGQNNPSTPVFWEVSQVNRNIDAANALSISIGTGITRFSRFQKGLFKKPIGWFNAAKKISTDCERDHKQMRKITKDGRKYGYFRFNVPERRTNPDDPDDPDDPDFDPEKAPPSLTEWLKKRLLRIFRQDNELLDRGLGKIKLDEWKERGFWRKESTKEEIERVTRAYLAEDIVNKDLETVARKLVDLRRLRAKDSRWDAYALGIRYECPIEYERCVDETYTKGSTLRSHLIEDHEIETEMEENDNLLDDLIEYGKYYEYHH